MIISGFLPNSLAALESSTSAASKALEDATKARRAFEVTEREKEKTAPANSAGSYSSGSKTSDTLFQAQSIAQQFLDYMDKSPDEMMREAILKDLGITEEELAAMDPEERAKIEMKIQERVEQKIEESMREKGIEVEIGVPPAPDLANSGL